MASVSVRCTTPTPGAQVTADVEPGGSVRIDIRAPGGVGSMQCVIQSPPMTGRLVIRLHLSGLEELRLAYGDTRAGGSIASYGDNAIRQWLDAPEDTPGRQQEPISPDSPYWMPMRLVPYVQEPAAIPLHGGWIEVELPPDFYAHAQHAFSLRWIDFYR